MTTIDDYLKGNYKATKQKSSFNEVFSKYIVNVPYMADIFSRSLIAKNSYGKLKALIKYLIIFFPAIDLPQV